MTDIQDIQLFNVTAAIPSPLTFLETLARNLWWCWNANAIELFRRINPKLWRDVRSNPLVFLSRVPQKRMEALTENEGFLTHLRQVKEQFEAQILEPRHCLLTGARPPCIAYFSLEYGIHESVRLYSGGLGVLAGDHLKAASDTNLPLVAVGLLYRQGYFQQYLDGDAWQQESYPENEIQNLPLSKAYDSHNRQVQVHLPLPEGVLKAVVWRLDVGRIPLYLLDTNIPDNPPEFRKVTAQLYGGDKGMRLRQELLLGVGGFKALLGLGHDPHVCHINEGHAAFLSLARIHHLQTAQGLDTDTVLEIVRRTNVFTTHTPVPAGNETFKVGLLAPHLKALQSELDLRPEQVIAWGQPPAGDPNHEFSMTILGLNMANGRNGVSKLHGKVARRMWSHIWPGRPVDEIPIDHITNGIHMASWVSADKAALYSRYLGPEWHVGTASNELLSRIAQIPDEELWRTHELARSRLIRTARERVEMQLRARNANRAEIAQSKSILDHDALTIGFARRFATYKRATLLLREPERFETLLCSDDRPVQIVFAGKAHPADDHGKDLIRQIVQFSKRSRVIGRVVFLENYDMGVARRLVQGVDLWLNTPRRPEEASGTSGMKAGINGGLQASILDGWWCEGYQKDCGWAIGQGEEYDDTAYQDSVETQALYNLLENDIIPCFYDRPTGDVPQRWTRMMKASIKMVLSRFTSHRMVSEYSNRFYSPSLETYSDLVANNAEHAVKLVAQNKRLKSLWNKVRIEPPRAEKDLSSIHVGDTFGVISRVYLGELRPDEVDVEVYYGPVDSRNRITESHVEAMCISEDQDNGHYIFRQEITCRSTGRYGFTARLTPSGTDWKGSTPGFINWAKAT